jgi:hypothetical protein
MDRKIIHFPTPGTRRLKAEAASLPQNNEVVELTLTIPKTEAGPSTFRY